MPLIDLFDLGARNILLKGAHLSDPEVPHVLRSSAVRESIVLPRIDTPHTHGTGCTLASAVATLVVQNADADILEVVECALAFVASAIKEAPGLGAGHGPLWHQNAWALSRMVEKD